MRMVKGLPRWKALKPYSFESQGSTLSEYKNAPFLDRRRWGISIGLLPLLFESAMKKTKGVWAPPRRSRGALSPPGPCRLHPCY